MAQSSESLSTIAQRSIHVRIAARFSAPASPSGSGWQMWMSRGMPPRPKSSSQTSISSSSRIMFQRDSGQSIWHQGETSSRVNGMRPTGVEMSTTVRGSSASASIAVPSAVSRHGGPSPVRITTRSGEFEEPSHHEPGRRHRIARRALRWSR